MGKRNLKYLYEDLTLEQKEQLFYMLSEDIDVIEGATARRERAIELATIGEYEEEARERYDHWGKMMGLSTGYASLDACTLGLVGGELIVIGGRTSHGKTQLAINIAYRVALAGNTALFVTLEMRKPELTSRVMKISDPLPITQLPLLFQKANDLDWKDIDDLIGEAKNNGAKLVVIDHLHYFSRSIDNTAQEIGKITKEFKKNAITHDIPIILISHVRKQVGVGKKITRPRSDDLRDSSFVAQDADIILMVFREDQESDMVEVFMEKNRNRGMKERYAVLTSLEGAKLIDKKDQDLQTIREAIHAFDRD